MNTLGQQLVQLIRISVSGKTRLLVSKNELMHYIKVFILYFCITAQLCVFGKNSDYKHVVLDENISFPVQLTDSNTIYEILSDFYVSSQIKMPKNCTLLFKGGHMIGTDGACLIGDNTYIEGVSNSLRDVINGITLEGMFVNEETNFSWWGAYSNDSSKAEFNGKILKNILLNKQKVIFDGEYYISLEDSVEVDHPIIFYGGIIHWLETRHNSFSYIKPIEGFSFTATNVLFYNSRIGNGWLKANEISFVIDHLEFINCSFISGRRAVNISFADLDFNHKLGVNRFTLHNCHISDNSRCFTILDGAFFDTLNVTGNEFINFTEAPVYLASTNSKQYATERMKSSCVANFINNRFICTSPCTSNAVYHCSVVAELNEVYFEDNYIEGIASIYDGQKGPRTCYDAYLSCKKVYYRNNTIRNVMGWRTDGKKKDYNSNVRPRTEIFKSKSSSSLKVITGNLFEIDSDWIKKNNIPDSDNWIGIFVFQGKQDNLIFENNTIKIPETRLEGRVAVNRGYIVDTTIRDNYFEAYSIRNLIHNGLGKNITISNNTLLTKESPIYILRISKIESNFDNVIVKDNQSNNTLSMGYSNASKPNIRNIVWDSQIDDTCMNAGTTYLYSGSEKCNVFIKGHASGKPNYQFKINEKSKNNAIFCFDEIPQSFCVWEFDDAKEHCQYILKIEMVVESAPVSLYCEIFKKHGVVKYKLNGKEEIVTSKKTTINPYFNGVKIEFRNNKLYILKFGVDRRNQNTAIRYIICND